jgi:SNF2 family DNA or RNA helicase
VRSNWQKELQRFSTTKGISHLLRGDYLERFKTFADVVSAPSSLIDNVEGVDWAAMILSYGLLRRDHDKFTLRRDNEPIWDLAILDEMHNIKSVKAGQTQAAMRLRDSSRARLGLTGTPMPNRASELYSQLEFLGRGLSGFKSQKQFARYYQQMIEINVPANNAAGALPVARVAGLQNVPLLKERLARVSFIIRKEEALEGLPPKLYDICEVEMTQEQTAVYERVLRSIMVTAERELGGASGDGRNYNMVVNNVLKRMLRLTQITSGFYVSDAVVDDDGEILQASETHIFDPNPKLEMLVEQVKDAPRTSKKIIWACYKLDVRYIAARLKLEGKKVVTFTGDTKERDRELAIEAFNNDFDTQFMVGTAGAGGQGLNLLGQANEFTDCDHHIYFSQNFNAIHREQSEARSHRKGTRRPVLITDLVVPNTIDQQIRECVVEKKQQSYSVQDVRDLLGRLAANIGQLRE